MAKSRRRAEIVAGLGFGDEGKGTTVDWLTRELGADLVVRYNGGAQAGHNVVLTDGRHHCFSQFGSGTFGPVTHIRATAPGRTHLSRFMIVNPVSMLSEAIRLKRSGVSHPLHHVTVERDALVTTPFHVAANRIREIARDAAGATHGSCGMGVGETMKDSLEAADEVVLRAKDLLDEHALRLKLAAQQEWKRAELRAWHPCFIDAQRERLETEWEILDDPGAVDAIVAGYMSRFVQKVRIVGPEWLDAELQKDQPVIFEGAQGVLLDQDYGFHPHTTWTDITFKNARTLLEGYTGEVHRLGVIRTHQTRHGAGPFVTQQPNGSTYIPQMTEGDHNVWTPWQRDLRVGALDLVMTRYAIDVLGGIDGLVVTHLDKIRRHESGAEEKWEAPVCTGYDTKGAGSHLRNALGAELLPDIERRLWLFAPGNRLRVVRPADLQHQELLGRYLTALPPAVAPYLEPIRTAGEGGGRAWAQKLAGRLGVPLALVSFGPTSCDKRPGPDWA